MPDLGKNCKRGVTVQVYRTSRQARVHFDPDCRYLHMGVRRKEPIQTLDLASIVNSKRFCEGCKPADLPQAPRVQNRRPCAVCHKNTRQIRPCAHNGGVQVFVYSHQVNRAGVDVPRTYKKYRWPENVGGADLVPTGLTP